MNNQLNFIDILEHSANRKIQILFKYEWIIHSDTISWDIKHISTNLKGLRVYKYVLWPPQNEMKNQ